MELMMMLGAIDFGDAPSGDIGLRKISISRDALLQIGRAYGDIHRYGIEAALKIRTASPAELSDMMREALARLVKIELITSEEEQLLGGLADAMRKVDDLSAAQAVLDHITFNLSDSPSPVAAMLASVASDSIQRDCSAMAVQLPPGAQARVSRQVVAWFADVAGGTAGAVLGSWGGMGGALIVGGVAAGAASAYVLT
jgi:hypothetical protein